MRQQDNASSQYTCFNNSWDFGEISPNLKQNLTFIICSMLTSTAKILQLRFNVCLQVNYLHLKGTDVFEYAKINDISNTSTVKSP